MEGLPSELLRSRGLTLKFRALVRVPILRDSSENLLLDFPTTEILKQNPQVLKLAYTGVPTRTVATVLRWAL